MRLDARTPRTGHHAQRCGPSPGGRGAEPPSYLDTGAVPAERPKKSVARRIRTRSALSGRAERARERRTAARVIREHRKAARGNPWSPEAVARREAALRVLSEALERCGLPKRARDVAACGACRALFEPELGEWVQGESGLVVAEVDECGHRICPLCAPRASRRNRRRILERVALLDDVARRAAARTLVPDTARERDVVVDAAEFVRAQFHGVPADGWRALLLAGGSLAAWRDEDDALRRASACRIPSTHPASIAWRKNADRSVGAWLFRAHAAKEERRAYQAVALAVAREDAAAALRDVEGPGLARWLQRIDAAERAAREWWSLVEVFEDVPVYGPPALRTRERERVLEQLSRARGVLSADGTRTILGGDARRALATLERQHREALERLRADVERGLRRASRLAFEAHADLERALEKARAEARAKAAAAKLWRSSDVRFITCTLEHKSGASLESELAEVMRGVSRLGRMAEWKRHVAGAVVKVEVEPSTRQTRRARARRDLALAEVLRDAGLERDADEKRESALALLRRNTAAKFWNVHVHVAASCGFWDQGEVSALWSEALSRKEWVPTWERWSWRRGHHVVVRGVRRMFLEPPPSRRALRVRLGGHWRDVPPPASHVDIRKPARGVRGVLDELTKYITKPVGLGALSVDDVADLARGLSGRRLLRCTGALRGVAVEEERDPSQVDEAAIGDGHEKPIGYVPDPSSIFGRRPVFMSDHVDEAGNVEERTKGVWVSGARAKEARRVHAERAWDNARRGRTRVDVENLPAT